MSITPWLSDLLIGLASQPFLLVSAILLATFILEDVATVIVALLASRMLIPADHALAAVIAGTFLGDVALYAVARWAGDWRVVARWKAKPAIEKALVTMRHHSIVAVIAARFMPGTRLPVFVAAGVAGMAGPIFVALTLATTLLWTPALYHAATSLDTNAAAAQGTASWAAAATLIVAAFAAPRLVNRLAGGRRAR